jgi:hypothetical protein
VQPNTPHHAELEYPINEKTFSSRGDWGKACMGYQDVNGCTNDVKKLYMPIDTYFYQGISAPL